MVRIRTLPKAVEEIRGHDPNSYINVPLLRKWVKQGLIAVVPTGSKQVLIDMDKLERFLAGCSE